MALTPEIHWEDGGLLRPQHLQAFQRHCHGLISQLALTRSFGYGVRNLRIREQSVTNWVIEIESCEVLLPDGSIVVAGETARLSPENFRYRESETGASGGSTSCGVISGKSFERVLEERRIEAGTTIEHLDADTVPLTDFDHNCGPWWRVSDCVVNEIA